MPIWKKSIYKGAELEKIGLILGFVLLAAGMYRIDTFLIPTLDYFGKYVFFAAINIFVVWMELFFYRRFGGWLKTAMPILFGLIVLLLGFKLGV